MKKRRKEVLDELDREFSVTRQLGSRVSFLRKQMGLSQVDFAVKTDLSKTYICDFEAGRRNASIETISTIASALEVTLSELFRGIVSLKDLDNIILKRQKASRK